MQVTDEIVEAIKEFGGHPQKAAPLASFLGFQPINSPQDQLAGPLRGGLKWFFAQRSDRFGVKELYRVGSYDAKPGSVGLWIAVLSNWGSGSTDRDRARRRVARALIEQTPDARALALLVPNELERRRNEAEFVLPRSAAAVGKASDSGTAVSSVRALVNLEQPNRFHRELLRDLSIQPGASMLDVSLHWQQVFSVERVTTRFYEEYSKVRDRMAEALLEHNKAHPVVSKLAVEVRRAWATRQMGRMLFLWFLQSKQWLGEPDGQGYPNYLVRLWDKRRQASVQEYYRDLLVPLFFEGMATDRPSQAVAELLGYTPYLNGGLFRTNRLEDEMNQAGEVSLPDEVFDPNIELYQPHTVLSLLSGYRFTTRESTPDDQSVDPDPELLGRVFENLYQGDERKKTGTYYTPREIVHFMCRQALDGYLRDQTGATQKILDWLREQVTEKEDDSHPLPTEVEERLVLALESVRVCDPAVGSGAFLLGMMQEIILLRRGIEYSKREYIPDEEQLVTDWKRHTIQYSLYGVDINPEAVEICQLRLWLSLVLDLLKPPQDAPLPNLDFRIVAGDSLVDRLADVVFRESWPAPGQLMMSLEAQRQVSNLERQITQWRQEFESTHKNPPRLRQLRNRIATAQAQIIHLHLEEALTRAHESALSAKNRVAKKRAQAHAALLGELIADLEKRDFALVQKPFLWPIAFPDILPEGQANCGFDIVLANPPYIKQEKLDATDQDSYQKAFPEVYTGTADILVFFYARALQILRAGGWLAFITSNKYMHTAYGSGLRAHLPAVLAVHRVLDFGDLPLFEANGKPVAAYPAVVVGRKGEIQDEHALRVADLTYPIRKELAQRGLKVNPENARWTLEDLGGLLDEAEVPNYPQVLLRKEGWILEDPALVRLFERLMNQGRPLGEFVDGRIYYGIKTGLNEAFVIDQAKRDELVAEDPRSAEIIKPWLRGRDIKRWRTEWAGLYLIAVQNSGDSTAKTPWRRARSEAEARRIFKEHYPAVHDHLSYFENDFINRRGKQQGGLRARQDQGHFWWELRACDYYPTFAIPKVIWPDITGIMRFAWDTTGLYLGNTAYIGVGPKWMVALLNSSILEFLARTVSTSIRGGYMRLIYSNVAPLPIVEPGKELAERLSAIASTETADRDAQVNELVADAYDLQPNELKMVEDWAAKEHEFATDREDLEENDN